LWLYKAVLILITYAAVVWWLKMEKVEARNLLKSLQGNYLRMAVGATPTKALETTLWIFIMGAAYNTAYRLKCQGE